jgi:hypothetical protein
MGLSGTEVELRAWMDRLAIQDLPFGVPDAITRADWDQCLRAFAPDAVWESPGMGMLRQWPLPSSGFYLRPPRRRNCRSKQHTAR